MTYTLKLNFGDEQTIKEVNYHTLQIYSEIEFFTHKGYWYKQGSKNWDFDNITVDNPIPNFIINLIKTED